MQQEAPRGETTRNPGRLRRNIKARGVRFSKPGAVVGIKGGRSGVFYGWFVTSGRGPVRQTKEGPKAVTPVTGRPFVIQTVRRAGMLEKALEAFSGTVEKFLNDEPFRNTILKFKRGNQR